MDKPVGNSGSRDGRDVLVILSGDRAAQLFEQVRAICRVHQMASPRIAIVECSSIELSELNSIPGVTVITGGDLPPEVSEGLDEGEALFVAAWLSRRNEQPPKQRRGEGQSWDAPGFQPPDPPTPTGATDINIS